MASLRASPTAIPRRTRSCPAPNGTLAVTYRYDARGRLVEQAESDGVVQELRLRAAGNRTGFALTRNGTVELSLGYAYDSLNRLAEVKKGETVIARYAYDDNGNRISLEYPRAASRRRMPTIPQTL